jgi:hypothetical protein
MQGSFDMNSRLDAEASDAQSGEGSGMKTRILVSWINEVLGATMPHEREITMPPMGSLEFYEDFLISKDENGDEVWRKPMAEITRIREVEA